MIQMQPSALDYSPLKYLKNNADLEAKHISCITSQSMCKKLAVHDFIAQGMEHKNEVDFENWLTSFDISLSFHPKKNHCMKRLVL
jgi:hypothetical protein